MATASNLHHHEPSDHNPIITSQSISPQHHLQTKYARARAHSPNHSPAPLPINSTTINHSRQSNPTCNYPNQILHQNNPITLTFITNHNESITPSPKQKIKPSSPPNPSHGLTKPIQPICNSITMASTAISQNSSSIQLPMNTSCNSPLSSQSREPSPLQSRRHPNQSAATTAETKTDAKKKK
ncbi:hypothetical protein M0R45_008669 [Rubus argutus]|uniref:Uncharacterized protein n=1 Tax=Rubus argutus TaxID=59490 RepID=A0AAW1Y3R6_RUBAR